jgi:hypothetical protein
MARDQFLGVLSSNVSTNTFEALANNALAPQSLDFGFAGTATLNGSGTIYDSPLGGRFATSGSKFWEQTVGPNTAFNITFSQAIAAFGFYGTDIGDFNGRLTLSFFNGATKVGSFVAQDGDLSGNAVPSLDGNLRFWGVTFATNAFNKVEFVMAGNTDVFGFDDMTIADASQVQVPEPSSLALVGSGMLALVGIARRRRA